MTNMDLTCRISGGEAVALARHTRTPEAVAEWVALLHSANAMEARNAAWVMTHLTDEQIVALKPRQNEFIDLIMHTQNTALRRLVLNLVERQPMEEADLRTDFLDFCLEHMSLLDEPPGVQTLCIKLAYRQCRFYPELMQEFRTRLALMQEGYAKCVQSLLRKMMGTVTSD